MTDEELIEALRVEVPFALFNGTQDDWDAAEVKLQSAADRLEALTQPSGKVSDEMVERACVAYREAYKDGGAIVGDIGMRAALEAALSARPVVRVERLIAISEKICKILESETGHTTIFEQVELREALSALEGEGHE